MIRDFATWALLGRTQKVFGSKSFGIYIWITPLAAKFLDVLAKVFGWHLRLPIELTGSFLCGGLFLAASLIYKWRCPPEHQDLQDFVGVLERGGADQDRVVKLIEARQRMTDAAAAMARDVFNKAWLGKVEFDPKHHTRLRRILVASYVRHVDNARGLTFALRDVSQVDLERLNLSRPVSRYAMTGLLVLSIGGAAAEFVYTAYDVIKATL